MTAKQPGRAALCLCGGGITGAMYELGALLALDDFIARPRHLDSNRFDLYIGTSAVGDNLVGMLERDGYNVSGAATVESPIFDSSVASSYLENGVVRIYHRDDQVVPSLLRAILWDRADKTIELNQATSDPHSGPMNSDDTVEELNRSFPEMQLDM